MIDRYKNKIQSFFSYQARMRQEISYKCICVVFVTETREQQQQQLLQVLVVKELYILLSID